MEQQVIHTGIGNIGHLFVIISFVTSLLAAFAYFKASNAHEIGNQPWIKFARYTFFIHAIAVIGIVVVLFLIIYNRYFEYHYAYAHSSSTLPVHYMISSFWEGQEGSFLLWLFWHVVLGLVIIKTNKKWEAPVMTIFAAVQAFLASMILGVVFGDIKLGSSPFMLVRDVFVDDQIILINPNYVPEDGTGLNPLLQNYWMVIHPPTLFLGFATTLVPFSYCIAGLWRKDFKDWVRPALPWAIFSAVTLGVGILMGGYWAYETLNFGGYWNWDPVENAVYVPWLVLVAAMHTMITFKKSATALKTSIILVITTFILILYSTFLTRSGILGDTSVHSFTDLGLSGQLLIYLLFFLVGSIVISVIRWKNVPTSDKEASAYSREFWIFIGALTLVLMSFQVLVPTSFPVFNKIGYWFGLDLNLAPPADQVASYSSKQRWFAIAVVLLSGTGQFFFWRKMDKDKLVKAITMPIVISLLISAIIFVLAKIYNPVYILILTAGVYSIVANFKIMTDLIKSKSYKLTGGSVAHIGIAMMLIGIMFSEGYSKPISLNTSMISQAMSDDELSTHMLLFLNEPKQMDRYELTYRGRMVKASGIRGYVRKAQLNNTDDPFYKVVKQPIKRGNEVVAAKGDTIYLTNPENTYYKVDYKDIYTEKVFSLYPRIQDNPGMGEITSPDIKREWGRDIYSFINASPTQEKDIDWGEKETIEVPVGGRFFVNDYVAELKSLERVPEVNFTDLNPDDIAVKAEIVLYGEENTQYIAEPYYVIKNRRGFIQPDVVIELASKISFEGIDTDKGIVTLGLNQTQKDLIIIKALEKPHINVLWIGTLVMVAGFIIAVRRRYIEFMKMRDKGLG